MSNRIKISIKIMELLFKSGNSTRVKKGISLELVREKFSPIFHKTNGDNQDNKTNQINRMSPLCLL